MQTSNKNKTKNISKQFMRRHIQSALPLLALLLQLAVGSHCFGSAHLSQTRTGSSHPCSGTGWRCCEHFSQTALPQRRQWWRGQWPIGDGILHLPPPFDILLVTLSLILPLAIFSFACVSCVCFVLWLLGEAPLAFAMASSSAVPKSVWQM